MKDTYALTRLTSDERMLVDAFLEERSVTATELMRDAVALALGDTLVPVVTDGYTDVIASLNSAGKSLNDCAHDANLCATRFSGTQRLKAPDVTMLTALLMGASKLSMETKMLADHFKAVARLPLEYTTYVSYKPASSTTCSLVARISEADTRRLNVVCERCKRTRSAVLRDVVLAVVTSGGVEYLSGAGLDIVTEKDVAKLSVARRRWDTNATQIANALDRVRSRHEYSAYLDSQSITRIIELIEQTSTDVMRASMVVSDAVRPLLEAAACRR